MEGSKYSALAKLSKTKFRRYTGVMPFVFELMVLIIKEWESQTKGNKGRTNNLCVEDQILMLLEYYRENRTFFHLAVSYGLAESNVQRNIVKIEGVLLDSGYFRLDGKRALLTDKSIKNILVDATETPAMRPKKKTKRAESKAFIAAEAQVQR